MNRRARTAAMAASFLLASLAGYQPIVGNRVEQVNGRQGEIEEQMQAFIEAKKLAINADAYREQMASVPPCDLPATLDGKSYDRITRTAMDNGLTVVSLKVRDARTLTEFFSREAPAELRVAGEYHQFGRFLEAQSVQRDHATVHAMKIERSEGSRLILTAHMSVVRVTTDDEQAAWEKANPPPKKGGK